jgi:transglutaminase-like putative cysteine protease
MVRLQFSVELNYDIAPPGGDFIFNLHAAHTPQQAVLQESLRVSQAVPYDIATDPVSRNRYLRLQAGAGHLQVVYAATVEIDHYRANPAELSEVPVWQLPGAVLPYIYPSRYCQSDRLSKLAFKEFGHLPQGCSRVQAVCDWVQQRVSFESNSSDGSTSALDTLIDRAGVCRDFAHLMIALCRALNLPARFATGTDYGADPVLGPPDFHAYVEVYLSHRWYMFDPSGTAIPMGFLRLGTGRDAADSAFATLFGGITSGSPVIQIQPVANRHGQVVVPQRIAQVLSTDAG